MMQELQDCSYLPRLTTDPYQSATDFYYDSLQTYTETNDAILKHKRTEYGLNEIGYINNIRYNYNSLSYDLNYYFPNAHKYINDRYRMGINDPLVSTRFKFSYNELREVMQQRLSEVKKSYKQIRWSYWKMRIKEFFWCFFPKVSHDREYEHLVDW